MARAITITPDVAGVLGRSTVVGGNTVVLPEGQLDRNLYTAVDKVLKALGGKWSRGKGHVFALGLGDQLEQALAGGKAVDLKRSFEQFFTPLDVVDRMIDRLDVRNGDAALEPSAGDGRIARAMLARGAEVRAIEIDDRHIPALRTLHSNHSRMVIDHGDFMVADFFHSPTVIAMNPPFSKGQDVDHFRRAWYLLAPGGRLACILGEHAFMATDRRSAEFRDQIAEIGADVESLPAGTFKESGTMVGARIVYARKALAKARGE